MEAHMNKIRFNIYEWAFKSNDGIILILREELNTIFNDIVPLCHCSDFEWGNLLNLEL